MNQYIQNTRYAAENLINLVWVEDQRLQEKIRSLKFLENSTRNEFKSMKKIGFTAEGLIELAGLEDACQGLCSEITTLRRCIKVNSFSRSVIAGSVLQIAKQGISQEYSGLRACPNGRNLGGESLKNVIWQSRNQALHCEEGNYSNAVRSCFQNLKSHYGIGFQLAKENLAFEVIITLGWRSYFEYERDMETLLG